MSRPAPWSPAELAKAIHERVDLLWSFARIGRAHGILEATAKTRIFAAVGRTQLSPKCDYRAYTAEDDATIRARLAAHDDIKDIARDLERTSDAMYYHIRIMGDPKREAKRTQQTTRHCLFCGAAFQSWGPGNRLCKYHQHDNGAIA